MTDRFISGLPTGTIDALSASVPLELGMPTGTLTIQSSIAQLSQFMAQYGYLTGSYTPNSGFISENGAMLTYITGSSYRVESGAAEVNGQLLSWASPITRTGLTFTSGTMNYVYAYASGTNTPAIEESTTAPTWDSTLNYWKKTGDNTRRCIGFLQASNANTIRMFANTVKSRVSEFWYADGDVTAGSAKVPVHSGLSSFPTGTWSAVSLSNAIPTHSLDAHLVVKLIISAVGETGTIGISPYPMGASLANTAPFQVRDTGQSSGANIFFGDTWTMIKEQQTIYYRILSNSGNPRAQIEIHGCRFIR